MEAIHDWHICCCFNGLLDCHTPSGVLGVIITGSASCVGTIRTGELRTRICQWFSGLIWVTFRRNRRASCCLLLLESSWVSLSSFACHPSWQLSRRRTLLEKHSRTDRAWCVQPRFRITVTWSSRSLVWRCISALIRLTHNVNSTAQKKSWTLWQRGSALRVLNFNYLSGGSKAPHPQSESHEWRKLRLGDNLLGSGVKPPNSWICSCIAFATSRGTARCSRSEIESVDWIFGGSRVPTFVPEWFFFPDFSRILPIFQTT